MNKQYQHADKLIREIIYDLQCVIGKDDEDISCLSHFTLDKSISDLIRAKVLMVRAEEAGD